MKYKDVFKVWLYADVILMLLVLVAAAVITGEGIDDGGFVLLAVLVGAGLSLPSLIALLCFHSWYSNKKEEKEKFVTSYVAAIISINILYFLISVFLFNIDIKPALLYLVTTGAGLISFYIVYKQINRRQNEVL